MHEIDVDTRSSAQHAVQQTVMDRASRDWQPDREPWLDAVCRAAGAGMAVWHDGEAVTEIGRIDPTAWDGVEDTDPQMDRVRLSSVEVES